MSDLVENHIVGFPTRRLILKVMLVGCTDMCSSDHTFCLQICVFLNKILPVMFSVVFTRIHAIIVLRASTFVEMVLVWF